MLRYRRQFDGPTATIGGVLLVVGLAVMALASLYLADSLLSRWRMGMPLTWSPDFLEPAIAWLTGLLLSGAGAFLVWAVVDEVRARRRLHLNRE